MLCVSFKYTSNLLETMCVSMIGPGKECTALLETVTGLHVAI